MIYNSDLDDDDGDNDGDDDGDDNSDVDGDDDDDDINCVWLVVGNGAVACLVASPVTTAAVIAHLVAFCLPSPFLIQLSKISNPTSLLNVMLKVVKFYTGYRKLAPGELMIHLGS